MTVTPNDFEDVKVDKLKKIANIMELIQNNDVTSLDSISEEEHITETCVNEVVV